MRESEDSGKETASIIAVLCACLCLILAALTGVLSSDSIENFKDEVTGYIIAGLEPGS